MDDIKSWADRRCFSRFYLIARVKYIYSVFIIRFFVDFGHLLTMFKPYIPPPPRPERIFWPLLSYLLHSGGALYMRRATKYFTAPHNQFWIWLQDEILSVFQMQPFLLTLFSKVTFLLKLQFDCCLMIKILVKRIVLFSWPIKKKYPISSQGLCQRVKVIVFLDHYLLFLLLF